MFSTKETAGLRNWRTEADALKNSGQIREAFEYLVNVHASLRGELVQEGRLSLKTPVPELTQVAKYAAELAEALASTLKGDSPEISSLDEFIKFPFEFMLANAARMRGYAGDAEASRSLRAREADSYLQTAREYEQKGNYIVAIDAAERCRAALQELDGGKFPLLYPNLPMHKRWDLNRVLPDKENEAVRYLIELHKTCISRHELSDPKKSSQLPSLVALARAKYKAGHHFAMGELHSDLREPDAAVRCFSRAQRCYLEAEKLEGGVVVDPKSEECQQRINELVQASLSIPDPELQKRRFSPPRPRHVGTGV